MIGSRLRLARVRRGLSLRQVGEGMDVSAQAVAQWEKSNPGFTKHRIIKLANLLNVEPEWLDGFQGNDDDLMPLITDQRYDFVIPVIPAELAVIFAAGLSFKQFPISGYKTLMPSASFIGRGFAIEATKDNELWDFRAGDIAIFDNGLAAEEGDYVAALSLKSNRATVAFVKCAKVEKDDGEEGWRRYVVAIKGTEGESILKGSTEANIIAVMVESRRFYRRASEGGPSL
ncbi:helix-turn-helix transcriptional regulator [Methylobacterium sp. NMS12]|uniref:helix-turn-helix domain-containing protein n=1 Tax=Methylobacterium sp. NMS12 TaxID=3079766 RepID=UPI003F881390